MRRVALGLLVLLAALVVLLALRQGNFEARGLDKTFQVESILDEMCLLFDEEIKGKRISHSRTFAGTSFGSATCSRKDMRYSSHAFIQGGDVGRLWNGLVEPAYFEDEQFAQSMLFDGSLFITLDYSLGTQEAIDRDPCLEVVMRSIDEAERCLEIRGKYHPVSKTFEINQVAAECLADVDFVYGLSDAEKCWLANKYLTIYSAYLEAKWKNSELEVARLGNWNTVLNEEKAAEPERKSND